MNIAIPVDETKTNVCASLGRAPYFMIINANTSEKTIIDNPAIAASGGAGIKAAQSVIDQNVKAILTPRCGMNAAEAFKAAGIPLYQTVSESIDQSLEAFNKGELIEVQNIHPGFHGRGGK